MHVQAICRADTSAEVLPHFHKGKVLSDKEATLHAKEHSIAAVLVHPDFYVEMPQINT
jgi:hypothetical protein